MRRTKQRWTDVATAGLVVAIAACSSERPAPSATPGDNDTAGGETAQTAREPQVYKRGSGSVAAAVGPGGGTLELASGPRVDIPPGTLDRTQDIVLKEAPITTAFANQEHERTQGPTFVVGPPLEAPSGKSIRISVPLAAYPSGWGDVSLGYEYPVQQMVGSDDAEHTKWQYESAKHEDGLIVAELQSINGYRMQFVLANLAAQ
jgi:hypothetical protein